MLGGMLLPTILLFLTSVLDQSLGQEEDEKEEEGEDLSKGSGISLEIQKEIVDKHNEMRRKVDPPASNMLKMGWNETIGENARKWAKKCQGKMTPNEDRTFDGILCGQSMLQSNLHFSWSDIINYWYSTSRYFKYGVGALDPNKSIYGYTQAIWYCSYQIGCAVSICPLNTHTFLYVCLYCPAGNIVGQVETPYKEGPPCGDCPTHCEDKLCTNPCKHVDRYLDCEKLKEQIGCKKANQHGNCKATCKCKNRIK